MEALAGGPLVIRLDTMAALEPAWGFHADELTCKF